MQSQRTTFFFWSIMALHATAMAADTTFPQRPMVQKTYQVAPGRNPVAPPVSLPQKPTEIISPAQIKPVQKLEGQIGVQIEFDWRMRDRFGLDENRNGIIDIRNTRAYAFNVPEGAPLPNEPDFVVELDAGKGIIKNSVLLNRDAAIFAWRITGKSDKGTIVSKEVAGSSPKAEFKLPEGNYTVDLRVSGAGLKGGSSQQIRVEDIVIVALGDSYSSGEGNPESSETVMINSLEHLKRIGLTRHPSIQKYLMAEPVKATFNQLGIVHRIVRWADDGLPEAPGQAEPGTRHIHFWSSKYSDYFQLHAARSKVGEDHIKAHRSSKSWPAMAALAIERADPHSSVTFIHLASSGATIDKGILGKYSGTESESMPNRQSFDPQVDQMKAILSGRNIDLATLSVGGNDVGFSNAVTSLVALNTSGIGSHASWHPFTYDDISMAFYDGNWERAKSDIELLGVKQLLDGKWEKNLPGIKNLKEQYDLLREALKKSNVNNVWMTTYPNPLWRLNKNNSAEYCDKLLNIHTRIAPSIQAILLVPAAAAAIPASIDVYIDSEEIRWAQTNLMEKLRKEQLAAVGSLGWVVDNGIEAQSQRNGHGMCAERLFNYPAPGQENDFAPHVWKPASASAEGLYADAPRGTRWFRTQHESLRIQGGKDTKETVGTLHPNEFGHWGIAKRLLNTAPLPVPIQIPDIR